MLISSIITVTLTKYLEFGNSIHVEHTYKVLCVILTNMAAGRNFNSQATTCEAMGMCIVLAEILTEIGQ